MENGGDSLEDIKNEIVNLDKIPVEEVFKLLRCSREGLSEAEGAKRLETFGRNKLDKKKENIMLRFFGFMFNPLTWVIEVAAIMAVVLANSDGKPPGWQIFVGIVCLLVSNSMLCYMKEYNAGKYVDARMAGLSPRTKVLRDGKWSEKDASILVPGDIVSIKLGDIIPCDARLLEGDALKVDQSCLTGESRPTTKGPGDKVLSGSTCEQGEMEAVVIATGVNTFFGKAADLVDITTNEVGHSQKVVAEIGNFCLISVAIGIVIELIVMYPIQQRNFRDGIENLLVLLIGGIPIALPTVISVTMAIGSLRLYTQGATTKGMTAIEKLAALDVLCSDKTGVLTLNKLSVDKNLIEVYAKNIYPFSSLLGNHKDKNMVHLPVDDLIERADGFAGATREYKYDIVKKLQEMGHICGMIGDGVSDVPALRKADIGITVRGATEAALAASDIVLTEPGLSVIINAVLTSRATLQQMKNYTIYAVSLTIRVVFGFTFIALIWKFDFSPFIVLAIALLNDGAVIMSISKDRVKMPSPTPDSWKLDEVLATGVVLGGYMALVTVVFFWAAYRTEFFPRMFNVSDLRGNEHEMMSALYLQVSIMSQAVIFVIRSRRWSFLERPGFFLLLSFILSQTLATILAVHESWETARIAGIGWRWAGVIWLYDIVFFFQLDMVKFAIRYILTGKACPNRIGEKVQLSKLSRRIFTSPSCIIDRVLNGKYWHTKSLPEEVSARLLDEDKY